MDLYDIPYDLINIKINNRFSKNQRINKEPANTISKNYTNKNKVSIRGKRKIINKNL